MVENDLRCPQCGSPVLASANYCVICGIRLPDRSRVEVVESSGWDTPRSVAPIPPVEIPEFDEQTSADTSAAQPPSEPSAVTYAAIPDIEFSDLDDFIARDSAPAEHDESNGVISEEELEIDDMIEEGGPVYAESSQPVDSETTLQPSAELGMAAATPPVAEEQWGEIGDVAAIDVEFDVEEMVSEGGPVIAAEPATGAPEVVIESNGEAIETTAAGAAAHAPVAAPESADVADTEIDRLTATVLMHEPDPTPMISASYPESETSIDDAVRLRPGEQYWWSVDSDDAWGDFSPLSQPAAPPAEPVSKPAVDPEALARAEALVDELRELLPQLGQAPGQEAPNLVELRSIAIAARGERSFDDWAALRTVSASAVGRPTDIDTILQLSKRVADIAALIAERDRLHDAFARIIDWIDTRNGA